MGGGQIAKLTAGMSLPEVRKLVKQQNINLYAQASGDFNPIHIDEDFARKTPAGGTIAHGMLILAYVSEMMTTVFGQGWLSHGRLNVRFKAPARPGDTVTVSGKIRSLEHNGAKISVDCDILCTNQKDETIIAGEAKVGVK